MLELIAAGAVAVLKVGVGFVEFVAVTFEAIGMTRRKAARDDERRDDER